MENKSVSVSIPECDINENIIIERLRINPLSDITEPPVYCRIGDTPSMTAGNFSLINGKAKSGKTFLLGAITASVLDEGKQLGIISGTLPGDKSKVLYFDTEQSNFHATRTIKRICQLAGEPDPDNLIAYGLRPLPPAERLAAIEEKISTTDDLGFVVIDGVRDLLTMGINDEAEATTLTSKFLKWTADYNIHIVLLLHQNKTDLNARGHIGTEILNKAETTITVTRDAKSNLFLVSCEYSRDIAFDDFGFTIEDGLPVASGIPSEAKSNAKNPKNIDDNKHIEVLNKIFRDEREIGAVDFRDKIIYGFDNTFGQSASKTFVSHYTEKKWVSFQHDGNRKYYRYERATF